MRLYAVAAITALTVLPLTGCSDPGATSCDEYAAMGWDERSSFERDLLISHDLEPNDLGNMTGVRDAINNFCGTTGIGTVAGGTENATQNHSEPVNGAIDWDSSYW